MFPCSSRAAVRLGLALLLGVAGCTDGEDAPPNGSAGAASSGGSSGVGNGGSAVAGSVGHAGASGSAAGQTGAAGAGMGGTPSGGSGNGGTSFGGAGAGGSGGTSVGGTAAGGAGSAGAAGAGGAGSTHVGFYVDGRTLRDRCGEKVVLRGVNEMVIYTSSQDGSPYFAEIAKTGANVVRITWNTTGSAAKLDAAMANAIANKMIPMVVLNDATGDLSKLGMEVDYWTGADVSAAIKKYQDKTLVNIANEAGNNSVTQSAFTSAYQNAITRLRGAGIHTPLIIDGSSWGQDIDMLQATGPGLLSFDPDHNLIFSTHMYWSDASGSRVMTEISQSVAMSLPLIVGEFAQHAVAGCSSAPFAYKMLMSVAKTSEIGYLPWSWGGVKNSDCQNDQPFDMSNGTYDGLQGWGKEVAVTDPNSIMNTSVRSHYMMTGSCN